MPEDSGLVQVPDDLSLITSDDEVRALYDRVVAEFTRVNAEPNVTPENVAYLVRLTEDSERLKVELRGRDARAAAEAERQRAALADQRAALEARVIGTQPSGAGNGHAAGGDGARLDAATVEQIAAASAQGTAAALVAALAERNGGVSSTGALERITTRARAGLAAVRERAPAPQVPRQVQAVTAGVDIPGIARGGQLNNVDALVDAFHRRAKGMPTTRDGAGVPQLVATMQLAGQFEHTVDDRTPYSQVEELFRLLTHRERQEALVAGGGWCAPSQIRYDFFNVACTDGLIDLPTFGVTRGGIRFPVSPSIADAFGSNGLAPFAVTFSNTSVPWLWTEQDDAATVTGSTNKPTLRVPCPSFSENRLECYGVTLTAGNLTDDAYPESTRNTLKLLMTAHDHAVNGRLIALMVAASSAAITGISGTNPVFQQVFDGLDLAATDYRAKYGMCEDDVLEVVMPFWLKSVIRADLAWRAGVSDLLSVTDAQIMGWFADRNIRAQFVNDWQVRGVGQFGNASTPMTAWPTSAQVMVYAAGTFLKGNGLTLDLGVVRDSVLNAENDFTAAWSEECHLIAKVGHESRLYTIGFNVGGETGALLADAARI